MTNIDQCSSFKFEYSECQMGGEGRFRCPVCADEEKVLKEGLTEVWSWWNRNRRIESRVKKYSKMLVSIH